MSDDFRRAVQRPGSFAQTLKAVAWAFFGVRKHRDLAEDAERLNPVHLVIAAVVGGILLIGGLLLLVQWVLSSGIAK